MSVADQEALRIVLWGGMWFLDLNDSIFAARDNQALGIVGRWGDVDDRVDKLLAVGYDGGFEGGGLLGGLSPYADGGIARDGYDGVGCWKSDISNLG